MALAPAAGGQGIPAAGAGRLRPVAAAYVACVLLLTVAGAALGIRLVQSAGAHAHAHGGPSGLGVPTATSFGSLEVESVEQITGLTPKALAGMTHGIQSLVQADHMQVQLVLALRNALPRTIAYDPAAFRIRLVGPRTARAYESSTTTVRAAALYPHSAMETTLGFVIPRFAARGTRISLEYREAGRPALNLDLGPLRSRGSAAEVRASLAHQHP